MRANSTGHDENLRVGEPTRYDFTETQARGSLALLILAATAGLGYLACRKYAGCNSETGDLTIFGYAFHHTLAGSFFPFFANGGSTMGNHPNFILWLALPFYWLAPTVVTLLLFQSLLINLSAIPVYLLGRDQTGNRITGLLAAVATLLCPVIISQHFKEIHDDQFGLALLLFAFYFYVKEDFKKFAVCLAGCLLAKETIALTTGMFGVWALLQRRPWKWATFAIGWSGFYLVLALKVFMAFWQGSGTMLYTNVAYFAAYGNTPRAVLTTMLTHPVRLVATILEPDRRQYLADLFLSLGWILPFGTGAVLLALPNLAINLLSSNPALRVIPWHYGSILGGILMMSLLMSLPTWQRWLTALFGARDYARWLIVVVIGLSLYGGRLWFHPADFEWTPARTARLAAVQTVPKSASVLCPDNLLAHFVDHPRLNSMGGLAYWNRDMNEIFDYDYLVFDDTYHWYDWEQQQQLEEHIQRHKDYRQVLSQDGVSVYQRIGTPPRILRPPPPGPR